MASSKTKNSSIPLFAANFLDFQDGIFLLNTSLHHAENMSTELEKKIACRGEKREKKLSPKCMILNYLLHLKNNCYILFLVS
ncbi:MAG: hypothetical protein ACYDFU_02015, partial [Nitrospirota bacterium]